MRIPVLIATLFVGSVLACGQNAAPPADAHQQLIELENRWLNAENDPAVLQTILADDFLHVLPQGIITKAEQINWLRKHPRPQHGTRHFEDLHVRVYGTVGVVNGAVVAVENGAKRKTWFTDVFAYQSGRWQAVSAQELSAAE